MAPRFNFAPVSDAKSTGLRIASGWFIFNGAFYGFLVAAYIVALALGKNEVPENVPRPLLFLGLLIAATTAVGLVWTGVLLARGRRLGGILALALIIVPIVFNSLTGQAVDRADVVIGVVGVIVVLSVWRELS